MPMLPKIATPSAPPNSALVSEMAAAPPDRLNPVSICEHCSPGEVEEIE